MVKILNFIYHVPQEKHEKMDFPILLKAVGEITNNVYTDQTASCRNFIRVPGVQNFRKFHYCYSNFC